jgi:hypothetical protein
MGGCPLRIKSIMGPWVAIHLTEHQRGFFVECIMLLFAILPRFAL